MDLPASLKFAFHKAKRNARAQQEPVLHDRWPDINLMTPLRRCEKTAGKLRRERIMSRETF